MNKKVLILLAVVWTAALALVGFSELRPQNSESARETASTGPAEPETTGQRAGEPEATKSQAASRGGGPDAEDGDAEPEGATLRIGGEPGLEFTGRCVVDGEEREIGGQTPESYTYQPEERLECEISGLDRGQLRVSFSDGQGTNTVQQVGPQTSTLELTYTGGSLSTSTTSVSQTSTSQSSQQISSSQTSSSQSSSQTSSSQSSSSVVRSGSE